MKSLRIEFGAKETDVIVGQQDVTMRLCMPWVSGPACDDLHSVPGAFHQCHDLYCIESPEHLCGVITRPCKPDMREDIHAVYRQVFEATREWNLYRIWNYVPHINGHHEGTENYRSFSYGRSLAFEERFGNDFQSMVPAASAVGVHDTVFALVFVAGKDPVTYVENPQQVSAFQYPSAYGRRAPSFARGAVVNRPDARFGIISGTAAIKGHESLASGDAATQTELTLENVKLVLETMSMPTNLQEHRPQDCFFKTYVRHSKDLPKVREIVFNQLFPHPDRNVFLMADICRSELLVEIEGWVKQPSRHDA